MSENQDLYQIYEMSEEGEVRQLPGVDEKLFSNDPFFDYNELFSGPGKVMISNEIDGYLFTYEGQRYPIKYLKEHNKNFCESDLQTWLEERMEEYFRKTEERKRRAKAYSSSASEIKALFQPFLELEFSKGDLLKPISVTLICLLLLFMPIFDIGRVIYLVEYVPFSQKTGIQVTVHEYLMVAVTLVEVGMIFIRFYNSILYFLQALAFNAINKPLKDWLFFVEKTGDEVADPDAHQRRIYNQYVEILEHPWRKLDRKELNETLYVTQGLYRYFKTTRLQDLSSQARTDLRITISDYDNEKINGSPEAKNHLLFTLLNWGKNYPSLKKFRSIKKSIPIYRHVIIVMVLYFYWMCIRIFLR